MRTRVRARVHRAGREAGQITLLSITFAALALLLVTVVVSATGVHLERKRLLILADDLALRAADSLDLDAFYRGQAQAPVEGAVVPLTDADVRRSVEAYLDQATRATGLEGLQVVEAVSPDGRTARVTLAAVARPALVSWVTAPWSDGIALRATASARAW
ncbi:hypothetical protein [Pengzhenrongella frigida]|uniref:Uncharacterized protein n=1 Tax=Pengzhenrongella frigida TaxID=1259133 RepID=A0A4Q5MVH6_9MICO|nr:hypothetical protein [Cellulomonas sp. HLT2-17]RYV49596.1 hypothetical protein EUA98_17885 [Cellulomonas sp. HLT2-17]